MRPVFHISLELSEFTLLWKFSNIYKSWKSCIVNIHIPYHADTRLLIFCNICFVSCLSIYLFIYPSINLSWMHLKWVLLYTVSRLVCRKEYIRNDGEWLLRLDHDRHQGFCFAVFLGLFTLGEASYHVMSSTAERPAWWGMEDSCQQPHEWLGKGFSNVSPAFRCYSFSYYLDLQLPERTWAKTTQLRCSQILHLL